MIEIIAIIISVVSLGLSTYAVIHKPKVVAQAQVVLAATQRATVCSKCGRKVVRYETQKDGSAICANCPK
jgi:uncharacterized Zn finger protein (UPF0148 family)